MHAMKLLAVALLTATAACAFAAGNEAAAQKVRGRELRLRRSNRCGVLYDSMRYFAT